MTIAEPPVRRRITIIELLVVAVLAAILIAIALPVLRNKGEDPALTRDIAAVQEAVRRYRAGTGAYPTFGTATKPDVNAVSPWSDGALPSANSVPAFAGIDFRAAAVRTGSDQRVLFSPDYLAERPRHSGDVADDGTRRWRLDRQGTVHVELDGRSY